MSRYADLRWKVVDLEKELEREKAHSNRLYERLRMLDLEIVSKDKEIDNLKGIIHKLCEKLGGKGADND